MLVWQLHEAKARLSELVRTVKEEPVAISVRGEEEVVVISKKRYEALSRPKVSLLELLEKSPLKGMDIEFERDYSFPRNTDELFN